MLAIRAEVGRVVVERVAGNVRLPGPVHVHQVNLPMEITFRDEGNFGTGGIYDRIEIASRDKCQPCLGRAVSVHDVDLFADAVGVAQGGEDDLRAVVTPVRE